MRQIGINMHAVRGMTDEEYVIAIRDLGFNTVFTGTDTDPAYHARMGELLAKHGLVYETLHAPFKGINSMWLPGEEGDAMLARLKQSIDHCLIGGAGISVVHLSSGLTPPPVTDLGRARYTELVEYAASKKVRIAFENQRFLSNISWAFETFTDPSVVGFCWDMGHEACFARGREYMPLFGDRLICTHIHDNTAVFNDDRHMIPFDGMINYHKAADHLNRVGYTGPLTLEVGCGSASCGEITPIEYLTRCAAAVKKLRFLVDGE